MHPKSQKMVFETQESAEEPRWEREPGFGRVEEETNSAMGVGGAEAEEWCR